MTDAPKGHHGQLFVLREVRPAASVGSGIARVADGHGNLSQGQHVAVGIVARTGDGLPGMGLVEHGIHGAPVVPQVVHHTPHIGIVETLLSILVLRLAGREREHDGTARLVNGLAYHVNLVGVERTREVIDLQEIHAPLGIEVHDTVIIGLSGLIVLHQQVVLQPCTGRGGAVIHLTPRRRFATFQFVCAAHHTLRHTTHDMDAELQTHVMNLLSQSLEAFVLSIHHTRREARRRRQVASVLVEHIILIAPLVVVAAAQGRMVTIPTDVHHHILPAVFHQVVIN